MNPLKIALLFTASCAWAAVPDFYRSVDRIFWVVDNLDRTTAGWEKLGVGGASAPARWDTQVQFRGTAEQSRVRWASGRFADVRVEFIQPLEGRDAFSEFRGKHGSGIIGLAHGVPTQAAFDAEIARMREAGAGILQSGALRSGAKYVLFDTEREGKYAIGLVFDPEPRPKEVSAGPQKIAQYAFVARDLKAVSQYWAKLGFPEMSFTHPALWALKYHDRPGAFDALLGWQRHGNVVYEWIQPLKGPTVYSDQIAAHGEGLHHLALDVPDLDRASEEWAARGFPFVQGGAWGERDKPGYGRFAYQNTQSLGGTDVELLWNYRP